MRALDITLRCNIQEYPDVNDANVPDPTSSPLAEIITKAIYDALQGAKEAE